MKKFEDLMEEIGGIILAIAIIGAIIFCMISCSTNKSIAYPIKENIHTEITTKIDTIYIDTFLPIERIERITKDTIVCAETLIAKATASYINGYLNLLIENKKSYKPNVPIYVPNKVKIVTIEKDVPIYIDVPKTIRKLYGWQKYLCWCGVILNIGIIIYVFFKKT